MRKLTKEEFIEKLKNKQPNMFYTFEKTDYVNNFTKICVTCPLHGDFWIRPYDLLNGHGCKLCGKEKIRHNFDNYNQTRQKKTADITKKDDNKKSSNEKVIKLLENANQNGLFSWNINECKGMSFKITFHCNKCNKDFQRKVNYFIRTNNTCPYCNDKQRNYKYTTEEFIKKAIEVHGVKYDYSKTDYKTTDTKVEIICHAKDEFGIEHGSFWTTPHSHIGSMHTGCPKCSRKYVNQDSFIKRAEKIFDGKHSFEKTIYRRAFSDIIVTCKEHGDFTTTPNKYLNRQGCPRCNQSYLEQQIQTLLDNNGIKSKYYVSKKEFPWLGLLSLDFYLPEYNIAIECQGGQHYEPISFFNQKCTFDEMQKRDENKRKLCEENNIKLLYYTNIDKYIDNIATFDKENLLKEIKKYDKIK